MTLPGEVRRVDGVAAETSLARNDEAAVNRRVPGGMDGVNLLRRPSEVRASSSDKGRDGQGFAMGRGTVSTMTTLNLARYRAKRSKLTSRAGVPTQRQTKANMWMCKPNPVVSEYSRGRNWQQSWRTTALKRAESWRWNELLWLLCASARLLSLSEGGVLLGGFAEAQFLRSLIGQFSASYGVCTRNMC